MRATVTRSVRSVLILSRLFRENDKELLLGIVAPLDLLVCGVEALQSVVRLRIGLTARD